MSVQFALWNDAAFFAASQTRATIHEYEKDGNTFLEFVVQINTGTKPWGVLRLGLSLDPLNREISKTRKELMKESKKIFAWAIITSIIFMFVGSIIVYLTSGKLAKPLISLTESIFYLSR